MIEYHGAEGRRGRERLLWAVRVVQIPNVRVQGHSGRHLLEAQHGIRDTDSKIGRGLGMPVDLGDRTFNGIRILKDHHCLGGNALA